MQRIARTFDQHLYVSMVCGAEHRKWGCSDVDFDLDAIVPSHRLCDAGFHYLGPRFPDNHCGRSRVPSSSSGLMLCMCPLIRPGDDARTRAILCLWGVQMYHFPRK